MVQLPTPQRLDKLIAFGTNSETRNPNGAPILSFKQKFKCWCGLWQLTTSQLLQIAGLDQTDLIMVVVRHRESWDNITYAQLNGVSFFVKSIASDAMDTTTSYDLVTLERDDSNG